MTDKSLVYDLMSKIQAMKPNKPDKDNLKHHVKMEELLNSPDYAGEDKIDGCHYFQCASYFFSTDHVEKTDNFPHLRDFFRNLNMPNLLLDGEINYPGKTSQYCTHVTGADPSTALSFQKENDFIHYTMFDMLRTPKGTWLLKEPFKNRRKLLEYFYYTYIKGTPMEPYIHITECVTEDKVRFKDAVLASGREGIILKNLNSLYIMGKKPMWSWMKIKQKDEADLIIIGFEPANKEYDGKNFENWPYWNDENGVMIPVTKFHYNGWIGAIILGAYINNELTKICTSSGMDENVRKDMSENPEKYLNKVAKISYMEKTEAGYPRHPNFMELHPDKRMEECTWELK